MASKDAPGTRPLTSSPATAPVNVYGGRRRQLSLTLLVGANLLPLLGVLLFDWDVGALIILYWSENLVLGFYNILKMASVGGLSAMFPSLFFMIHYGGFCAVHGFFILSILFDVPTSFGDDPPWPLFLVFLQLLFDVVAQVFALAPREWIIAFVGLLISHGYSFVSNFLMAGERDSATVNGLMAAPYRRIVILHVAIIAGGFAVMSLGQPLVLLVILVGMKTIMDVALHLREHKQATTHR
ncbi:DUF6498-containing protein [Congregibacter litoralis]|uniref:Uncharacterized protein n=1 Tax=Congregibacter litoralis KT71 TaxID=314285 RepID=A4A9M4_9GAMM|nr:DUF6498-containing protein [Congregibacter litoralis]EAQ97191.1 hypothetical protein KT71_07424 [Congregibacter litoralis KT71]